MSIVELLSVLAVAPPSLAAAVAFGVTWRRLGRVDLAGGPHGPTLAPRPRAAR